MNRPVIAYHIAQLLKEIERTDNDPFADEPITPVEGLRPGLRDTPDRVARAYGEIFGGYREDPKELFVKSFEDDELDQYDQLIIETGIEFYSHCEHHMAPFYGTVDIGYLPAQGKVGLSKMARLVNVFAHRLQVQERMTHQIAKTFQDIVAPRGTMVVVRAKHHCVCSRGVKNQGAETVTSMITGEFKTDANLKAEFLQLKYGSRNA